MNNKLTVKISLLFLCIMTMFLVGCELLNPTYYTLTMEKAGEGVTQPTSGIHEYEKGAVVDVEATADEGWKFKKWVGEVADVTSAETSIIMNTDQTLKAVFEKVDEVIEFEDNKLEQAIREAIEKMEGDLLIDDVINLKELNASGRGIVSLEGIEYLQNLTNLNLGYDGATLDRNFIEDLSPLANLSKLKELYLGSNEISNLTPLNNLIDIEILDLFDNKIVTIDALENLVGLKSLEISNNQLEDIKPLQNLTSLETLRLRNNQLTEIDDLADLTNLKTLSLGRNELTDISALENLTKLEGLFLSRNLIGDIKVFNNLYLLTDLNFSGNLVEDISVLADLTNLQSLHFVHNEVTDISSLVENKGLDSECWIDMRYNFLDLTDGSANREDIDELIERGGFIIYEPQRSVED